MGVAEIVYAIMFWLREDAQFTTSIKESRD